MVVILDVIKHKTLIHYSIKPLEMLEEGREKLYREKEVRTLNFSVNYLKEY